MRHRAVHGRLPSSFPEAAPCSLAAGAALRDDRPRPERALSHEHLVPHQQTNRRSLRRLAGSLAAGLALVACGEARPPDSPILYERPQILPDNSPICLNYQPTAVGASLAHNVLLRNDGRQTLEIDEAIITRDARGHFEVEGVLPTRAETRESAVARFHYRPGEAGWDSALLEIASNAQNYPRLRIFVLALARPADLAPEAPYDPGPKPPEAFTADGVEACRGTEAPRR